MKSFLSQKGEEKQVRTLSPRNQIYAKTEGTHEKNRYAHPPPAGAAS